MENGTEPKLSRDLHNVIEPPNLSFAVFLQTFYYYAVWKLSKQELEDALMKAKGKSTDLKFTFTLVVCVRRYYT